MNYNNNMFEIEGKYKNPTNNNLLNLGLFMSCFYYILTSKMRFSMCWSLFSHLKKKMKPKKFYNTLCKGQDKNTT
jgi:hypothetical protein